MMFRDQTHGHRAEESLRESQEEFASIVSAAQDAILMIDPQGSICLWNQSAERIFGYSAAEAVGQHLHRLLVPARFHAAQQAGFAEFLRSGQGAVIGRVLELPALHKDGTEFPVELSITPLQLRGEWHAVGIARDVTHRTRAEQQLRDSEARYRTLFVSSADAVMTLAPPAWKFTACNPATLRMFNVKDEVEFSSLGPWELSPEMQPDSRPSAEKAKEMIETAMREGSHFFEWTHQRLSGEDFPSTVMLTRMEVAGQAVLQCMIRDITVQKRAEERAKLDEARATTLLELSQMTDRSAAEIANQALESAIRLTGSTIGYIAFANEDETVLTMHYWSNSAMKECATIDKPIVYPVKDTGLWGEAIRQRRPVVVNDYAAPNPLKKGTPPGHVRLTRHMNIPVLDGGRIVAVAGVGNKADDYQDDDVRQLTLFMDGMWRILCRKRAEEALQKFNRQLESAAAQVKTLMSNVIEKSVFAERFENPSLVPCWEEKQCDNTDCPSYQNHKNLRCWEAAGTLCGGTLPESSVEKHADCRLCEVYRHARANPVMDLGETFNTMIAILNDRQEQLRDTNQKLEAAIEHANRMTEQAQCANRAKSAFLANMSHEIRTPMTSMLGYTELLMEDSLSAADRKTHLTTVRRNAEYLLQLINDILDLSKIESGKMVMDLGPCRLASTIADVASMMRPRAEQRKNKIEVRYAGRFPETIRSDSNRIRQVIVNLVGNAVKFTEHGSIRINVSFLPQWRGDQSAVRVEVTDTGIGIRQEALARLFTPFTQAESSTTRKYGGTGLGLAISRQIVAALGGELTVESALGAGSTFTVMIPTGDLSGVNLLQSPGEVICEDDAGTRWTPAAGALRGVRILLAEDSPDNQELLSTVLGNVGAELEVVENGRLAVEHAEAGIFDVVLMDMNMPEMDGYEATRTLRDRGYPRPILALTANAMSGDCEQCLAAGCDAHLAKPIDRKQLIEAVAQYAGSKSGRSDPPPAIPSRAEIPAPWDGIVSCFADDPQLVDILPRFVQRLPDQLEALGKALEENRLNDAQRLAHRLKGAGGSYGYPTLSEAAKSLEAAVKDHDAERAAAALAEVKAVGAAIALGSNNHGLLQEPTNHPQEDWQL
jgi:PAS domain S-box-containing protein